MKLTGFCFSVVFIKPQKNETGSDETHTNNINLRVKECPTIERLKYLNITSWEIACGFVL